MKGFLGKLLPLLPYRIAITADIRSLRFLDIDKQEVISLISSWKKDEFIWLLITDLLKIV